MSLLQKLQWICVFFENENYTHFQIESDLDVQRV